jgi:hypothetical protein
MPTRSELFVVRLVLWGIAGVFAFGAAWFQFRESGQTEAQKQETRRFYQEKWEALERSSLRNLPNLVVGWLLSAVSELPAFAHRATELWFRSHRTWLIFVWVWCILIGVGIAVTFSWYSGLIAAVGSFVLVKLTARDDWPKRQGVVLGVAGLAAAILWPRAALTLPVWGAASLMLVTLPFLAPALGFVCGAFAEKFPQLTVDRWTLFGFSVAVSMAITVLALAVGALAVPRAAIPRTNQLLSANILCDGITVSGTILILRYGTVERKYPIPVAVCLSLVAAAALACFSLWIGVLGTDLQLSIPAVFHVIVGRNPSGASLELGPFFWSMHTAFIPTATYLLLVATCWIGRLLVLPVHGLFARGKQIDNPHRHTAMLFALMAVIFGLLGSGVGFIQDRPTDGVQVQPPAAVDRH